MTSNDAFPGQESSSERSIPVYDSLTYPEFLVRPLSPANPHLILSHKFTDDLTLQERHLEPNTPFLLSTTTTAAWPARRHWVRRAPGEQEGAGAGLEQEEPNLDGLRRYGHHIVPVADTLQPEYSEFRRTERPLAEVLDLWAQGADEARGLYVKDWHLYAETRGKEEVYTIPECFRDDWLNPPRPSPSTSSPEVSPNTSDFRFTYLGPAGTYTPLHRDVYSSYSWSANVVGRKLWWLFPPRPQILSQILVNDEPVFDVRELEDEGGGIKVVQQPGQVIWVPSGWYHQVLNLDFCISINHNFFSSQTLPRIYTALYDSQTPVERAIADVHEMIIERLGPGPEAEREWTTEVQGLLERDAGWGWRGFWDCVLHNVQSPPLPSAAPLIGPPVREVIQKYKTRPEWDMLQEVRGTVLQIERLVDDKGS